MLEFAKTMYMSDDLSDVSSEVKTTFACTNTVVVAVRLVGNKACRLVSNIDGTVGDLGAKINHLSMMSNSDFKLLSDIQFAPDVVEDNNAI